MNNKIKEIVYLEKGVYNDLEFLRDRYPSVRKLAEHLEVSMQTVFSWLKEGVKNGTGAAPSEDNATRIREFAKQWREAGAK